MARLWDHWRANGIVIGAEAADGPAWMFAPDGLVRTLDHVADVLGAPSRSSSGPRPGALDRVARLLSHAALEGRVFTGDAVAAR